MGTLELRPDRLRAGGWTLVGMALMTMGAWLVVDSRGALPAVAALAIFVVTAVFFALQLAVPQVFRVRLDPDWLQARVLWRRVRVPWDAVRLARVVTRLGDPWLVVDVQVARGRGPGRGPGPVETERIGIMLPLGADLDALRAWLSARLGRGG